MLLGWLRGAPPGWLAADPAENAVDVPGLPGGLQPNMVCLAHAASCLGILTPLALTPEPRRIRGAGGASSSLLRGHLGHCAPHQSTLVFP